MSSTEVYEWINDTRKEVELMHKKSMDTYNIYQSYKRKAICGVILALKRLSQEDCEVKASLGYTVSPW